MQFYKSNKHGNRTQQGSSKVTASATGGQQNIPTGVKIIFEVAQSI